MNHKVFRAVFVCAVVLALVTMSTRAPRKALDAPATHEDKLSRPLASFKVQEKAIPGGMDFDTSGYDARVDEHGFRFGKKDFVFTTGAPRLEQDGLSLECEKGIFS